MKGGSDMPAKIACTDCRRLVYGGKRLKKKTKKKPKKKKA